MELHLHRTGAHGAQVPLAPEVRHLSANHDAGLRLVAGDQEGFRALRRVIPWSAFSRSADWLIGWLVRWLVFGCPPSEHPRMTKQLRAYWMAIPPAPLAFRGLDSQPG